MMEIDVGPNDLLIELDDEVLARLQSRASALGVEPEDYARAVLERESASDEARPAAPKI